MVSGRPPATLCISLLKLYEVFRLLSLLEVGIERPQRDVIFGAKSFYNYLRPLEVYKMYSHSVHQRSDRLSSFLCTFVDNRKYSNLNYFDRFPDSK